MNDEDKSAEDLLEELRAVRARLERVEEPLRQMAAIVESSDDAIVSSTLDGIIVTWNPGAERVFGYTAEEVKGRLVSLFVPPNRTDEVPTILDEIRKGRTVPHFETVRKTKDGRLIDISLTVSPIKDRDGRVTGVSAIAHDITARRQMEEQLRETGELFGQLATNIDGYFWVNAADDSAMFYMSPGYEKITGRSCAGLYERPESWTEIIHPDDREQVLALVSGLFGEEPRQMEYRIVRPDGSIRWVRERAFPVRDASGEVYRVAGFGEDVTGRRQAEEKVREYYGRVQALSRRLLAVQEEERRHLARELHDGLCQQLTCLAMVFEAATEGPPECQEARIAEAQGILAQALQQTRELSSGLRPAMLDHLGLLPALLWFMEGFTSRTGVRVHFKHEGLGARFDPAVEIGAFRLVQEALTNIARHAGVNEVTLCIWVEGSTLHLQIEDEGTGFDPEAVRAAGATAGLTGMQERVQLLGGSLVIDSAPGEGTQLMAELPLES